MGDHSSSDDSSPVCDPKGARVNPAEFKVKILPGAVKQLKKLVRKEPNRYLRLLVNSGGCSGYQYDFRMESGDLLNKNADDVVFEQEGVQLVVDDLSLDFLGDCEIDYTAEMIRQSFQVVA